MENLELSEQEKKELEKRGFFVKEITSKWIFIKNIILSILLFTLSFTLVTFPAVVGGIIATLFYEFIAGGIIGIVNTTNTDAIIIYFSLGFLGAYTLLYILCLFQYIWNFSSTGKAFYLQDQILWKGIINKDGSYFYKILSKNYFFENYFNKFLNEISPISNNNTINNLYNGFILSMIFGFILSVIFGILWVFFIDIFYIVISFYVGLLILSSILPISLAYMNSLYQFGNIGIKIQKLTPKIEEQSKQIQSEFQSDMNFSVLSNGFDSLSTTFSEIVSLVIKLEKVEARANKGNLFDSEKYINSLRSDIVTPLTSLRTFLEKQKTELMKSQKELTRVRVGGNDESGNMELQSKRSNSLIQELTENIEKLDVMIGKMG